MSLFRDSWELWRRKVNVVVGDISTKKIATLGCNIGAKFAIATKDGNNDFWNWKITDKDFVAVNAGTDVTIYYIEL